MVQKANIFDMTEADLENFANGKYTGPIDQKAIQSKDQASRQRRASSSRPPELESLSDNQLELHISNKDYLQRVPKTFNNQKESIRDFINHGREILITQITINDKIEETKHLQEFIESEEEQLKEGRRLFEEDKQKFMKYLENQENQTNQASLESK